MWAHKQDKKLLRLSKQMPAQWTTIALILDWAPSQCVERYEKLLNAASAKEANYDLGNYLRQPNIDINENEKQLLSEAWAQLANKRAKRAKRGTREKQLEVAQTLASILKKRKPKSILHVNKHNDQESVRKRRKLNLPTPVMMEAKIVVIDKLPDRVVF